MKTIKISDEVYNHIDGLGIDYEDGDIEYAQNPSNLLLRYERRINDGLCVMAQLDIQRIEKIRTGNYWTSEEYFNVTTRHKEYLCLQITYRSGIWNAIYTTYPTDITAKSYNELCDLLPSYYEKIRSRFLEYNT